MRPRRTSQEFEDLAGLLADFGEAAWGAERVDEAFDLIAERSDTLFESFPLVATLVSDVREGPPFEDLLNRLCVELHRFLFEGILRNAGTFRQPDDPGGGQISFGGLKGQTTQPLLRGVHAGEIPGELQKAISRLADLREDAHSEDDHLRRSARDAATDNAVLFYKDFSGVHPFYDANGRIGRYVVSVYLHVHGRHVDWSLIDEREGKFLKKINDCLRRSWRIARYEQLLKRFWRKFVVDVETLVGD